MRRALALVIALVVCASIHPVRPRAASTTPTPLLKTGQAVDWFFVFKFNAKSFPKCDTGDTPSCPFGGTKQAKYASRFGQQFAFASSADHELTKGTGCAGDTSSDPVGATYGEIYNGDFNYVVWNDQFYGHPTLDRGSNCGSPWGHSKGMLAWNDARRGRRHAGLHAVLAGRGRARIILVSETGTRLGAWTTTTSS